MKLFEVIQTHFGYWAIYRSRQKNSPFNWKNIAIIFLFVQFIIKSVAYFLFSASTFGEHTETFFSFTTGIVIAICYLSIVYKSVDIFDLIDNMEEAIQKR